MVGLVAADFHRAIDLLEQHDSCQVVGERDGTEADAFSRATLDFVGHAIAAADDEAKVAVPAK